jgi:Spy/CpxP family protein refolding chaperone
MNKIITMTIAAAIALLISGAAFADDSDVGGGDKMAMEQKMLKKQAEKLDMLTTNLKLSPDQKDKVGDIIKSTGDQKKDLMIKMEADEKTLHDSEDTQIKAVLTPDQQVAYDKLMAEHRVKMQKKHDKDMKKTGM